MGEHLRERLISSATVFSGRLICVRVDEVELADGGRATREVVVHPGAVAIVPLLPGQKVVMIRQYRHPAGKVLYELPAGTLRPGESPEACARRELVEEVGYQAGDLTHLFSMYLSPGYCSERIHLYLATGLVPATGTEACGARPDEDERVEPLVVALGEAAAMIARGEVENAAAVAGLLAVTAGLPRVGQAGAGHPMEKE